MTCAHGRTTAERWEARTCADQPWRWDDHLDGELSTTDRATRMREAAHDCLTCPAIDPCTEWLAANPDATGVIAGQIRATRQTARRRGTANPPKRDDQEKCRPEPPPKTTPRSLRMSKTTTTDSRHVERALAKIARDGHLGRKPTYAHPDCTCLRTSLGDCLQCWAGFGQPCRPNREDLAVLGGDWHGPWLHPSRRSSQTGRPLLRQPAYPGDRDGCPIHGNAVTPNQAAPAEHPEIGQQRALSRPNTMPRASQPIPVIPGRHGGARQPGAERSGAE